METKIIQLTAGRGPSECAWVVAKVLKLFLKVVTDNALDYHILHKENSGQNGTVQSVTIQLKGKNLDAFLKDWLGTIQWIGTSTFRKYHKRKNWYIGCFEIEQNTSVTINEKDIQFQAIRSSGPGGQHVNKVSSAIRATHVPTNIQVLVMDSRSQHQWENHLTLQRGNPVKVFKGSDFKAQKKEKNYKPKRNQLKTDLRKQLK